MASLFTHRLSPLDRYEEVGVIDIETSGLDSSSSRLIAIGLGYYEPDSTTPAIAVPTLASEGNDELALIDRATRWLNAQDPSVIVTYNGTAFDLPFLRDRFCILGAERLQFPDSPHVDLYLPRQVTADLVGVAWPTLETCLQAYNHSTNTVRWEGQPLDNTRFGTELAPKFLQAISANNEEAIDRLEDLIIAYTGSDIEATVALYEADAGRDYEPSYERFDR